MLRLLVFIDKLLFIYIVVLFAAAVLSWLTVFNVVNTRHPVVSMIGEFLYWMTEPLLRLIRNVLPNQIRTLPIDVSFLALFLIVLFIKEVVIGNLIDSFSY
jgi:YggT family protein